MKLSFSTLGCPSWTLADVVRLATREAYDGIELRFIEGDAALWTRPEFTGTRLNETRRRLADSGLAVSCVDTSCFFHHPAAADRERALDEGRRMIQLAAALGAPGIRVFGDRVQAGATPADTVAWIADALQALGEEATFAGVGAWLETHGDFATGAATAAILDRVSSGAIGVVWDPLNAFSEFGEPPDAGWRAAGARVRHVHLKDARRPAAGASSSFVPWTPALMGEGAFPAADVLARLEAAAFDGYVSFEWEKRWHPEIEEPDTALPHFAAWYRRVRTSSNTFSTPC
jgi:sugar phosphate isomerase/epimerase